MGRSKQKTPDDPPPDRRQKGKFMRPISVMMHAELVEGVNWFPRYGVVYAGSGQTERSRAAEAQLKFYAALAVRQRAEKARATRDERGGMMPVKRGIARAATSDLTRIDECIRQMSSPSVDQVARQWGAEYVTRAERICAEAKEAYDARNPHKKAVAE